MNSLAEGKLLITIRFTLSQPSYSRSPAVRSLSSNSLLGFLIDNLLQSLSEGKKKKKTKANQLCFLSPTMALKPSILYKIKWSHLCFAFKKEKFSFSNYYLLGLRFHLPLCPLENSVSISHVRAWDQHSQKSNDSICTCLRCTLSISSTGPPFTFSLNWQHFFPYNLHPTCLHETIITQQ